MPTGKLLYHNRKEPFVMCQTAREVLLYIPSLYNTPNHKHTAHTHTTAIIAHTQRKWMEDLY